MKETSDLICGKAAVGGNYNSTRDNISETSEKIAPNMVKGKGSIEQYPEWDEEEDDYE